MGASGVLPIATRDHDPVPQADRCALRDLRPRPLGAPVLAQHKSYGRTIGGVDELVLVSQIAYMAVGVHDGRCRHGEYTR